MITEASAPDNLTILENNQLGGWPQRSGKLTAPLLCMNNVIFIIGIIFFPRAFAKYFF
jgi:hypothetical protein